MENCRPEEQQARERRDYQESVLLRRRRRSLLALAVLVVPSVSACILGLEFIFFCCVGLACLLLLNYFDTNGHLREVRRRSVKTLVPNFSLLQPDSGQSGGQGKASPGSQSPAT